VPAQNATPPELKRLQVSATERPAEKKVLTRRDEAVNQAEAGAAAAVAGDARMAGARKASRCSSRRHSVRRWRETAPSSASSSPATG